MKHARIALLASVVALGCGGTPAMPSSAPRPPAPAPAPPPPAPDAWRDRQPPSGTLADIHFPAIEQTKLDDGLTVYVVHRDAGVVTASFLARGGANRVPEGKSGLAALTARMMTEGTTRLGTLALAEAVESLGTSLEQSAGRDFVRLGLTTLQADYRRGLELLAEVVQKPAFAPAEFARVRSEWLDSIEAERQSPSRLAVLVGLRLLLGNKDGAPVQGSRHDVKALERKDLAAFHEKTFTAENSALVVVGNVTLDDVKRHAAELFGALPRGKKATWTAATPTPSTAAGKTVVVDRPGAVQSALFIVQPFPKRAEPGFEKRELLSALFGGFFTSRLNTNLREEHAYTYGARSLDIATENWGAFAVMTSVRTDVTVPALSEALGELDKIKNPSLGKPIAKAEVSVARLDRKQDLGSSLSHTAEVAERVEELFVHGLPGDYYTKYPSLLDGIDEVQVSAEAARLDPRRAVTVIVGDLKAIRGALGAHPFETAPDALTD